MKKHSNGNTANHSQGSAPQSPSQSTTANSSMASLLLSSQPSLSHPPPLGPPPLGHGQAQPPPPPGMRVPPQPGAPPPPGLFRHPEQMEKDEQLQLCIQRFVSDAQSMMNQFSEMFIGEVRRFADVCMEFSLAYRSVHEDRDFLVAENQSLKDELDARQGQLEMISKELHETREENEELVRRLECLGVPVSGGHYSASAGGSPVMVGANSVRIMDPVVMSRHYSVVNSMPAFPRRYSVATSVASYDEAATTAGSSYLSAGRPECASASPTVPHTGPNSAANSNNHLLLLTPPIDFKAGTTSTSTTPEIQQQQQQESKRKSASLSRDDILAYMAKYDQTGGGSTEYHQDGSPKMKHMAKQRSPSLDQMNGPSVASMSLPVPITKTPQDALSPAISSSAGTFYDCVSTCSQLESNTPSDRDPHLALTEEITRMCALMVAQSDELAKEMSEDMAIDGDDNTLDTPVPQDTGALNPSFLGPHFISKTPSPSSANYLNHYQLYMSKSHDDAREISSAFASGSELTEIEAPSSGPISRSNSRKKKGSINASSAAELLQQSKWYTGHPVSGSADLLDSSSSHRFPTEPPVVTSIPLPVLEMTRYLLVEVSHFISPSHFYLIVNDEKCGANAFEDFLEAFQNFYKSLEYLLEEEASTRQAQNGFATTDSDPTTSTSSEIVDTDEWKHFFTNPPEPDLVTPGSYWAGYMDDDYEWRRVQVTHLIFASDDLEHYGSTNELVNLSVWDVDSGYSTTIPLSSLRPLREEFGSIPAFAIRASLAYLYPRPVSKTESIGILEQPDDDGQSGAVDDHSEWPSECCTLFEALTYDQILTASIIEIHREDLTDTEVAQVLLWCSPSSATGSCSSGSGDDEIFINRKLIELNYAANVAEDDRWLQRSNETVNCSASARSSQSALMVQARQAESGGGVISDVSSCRDLEQGPVSEHPSAGASNASLPLALPETTPPATLKKKKIKKTLSKKKKESGAAASITDSTNDPGVNPLSPSIGQQPDVPLPQQMGEPNVLLGEPSSVVDPHHSLSTSSQAWIPKRSSQQQSTAIEICTSFYLSHQSTTPDGVVRDGETNQALGSGQEADDGGGCKFPIEACSRLHHDPRLSNWIVQKHSRHVKLKKSSHMTTPSHSPSVGGNAPHPCAYPTMSYLFRVTTVFDANKIIGILPFGERKLETDAIRRYINQIQTSSGPKGESIQSGFFSKIDSPFRLFVLEMTEFYQKFAKDHALIQHANSTSASFLETFLQHHQHQNQSIAFYDSGSGLYLRGYIVGKDPDAPRRSSELRGPGSSHNLNSGSARAGAGGDQSMIIAEAKRKTVSLKRPRVKFSAFPPDACPTTGAEGHEQQSGANSSESESPCSKWIIYGIDTGRYYLINSTNLYKLVDQFVTPKPFAIVCKLQVKSSATVGPNSDGTSPIAHALEDRSKLQHLIGDRLLCLQFHDIDFSTERNLVSLYRFVTDSKDCRVSDPRNILLLIQK